jgi:hypothetical protein
MSTEFGKDQACTSAAKSKAVGYSSIYLFLLGFQRHEIEGRIEVRILKIGRWWDDILDGC